jgi:hypothetical protein
VPGPRRGIPDTNFGNLDWNMSSPALSVTSEPSVRAWSGVLAGISEFGRDCTTFLRFRHVGDVDPRDGKRGRHGRGKACRSPGVRKMMTALIARFVGTSFRDMEVPSQIVGPN